MHKFQLAENNNLCIICDRKQIQHTVASTCDRCKRMRPTAWYAFDVAIDNKKGEYLCWDCKDSDIQILVDKVNLTANVTRASAVIADAKAIDMQITNNSNFYNNKTVAIIDLKKQIFNDNSLSDDEKEQKFMLALSDRYDHLKTVIFNIDNEIHALNETRKDPQIEQYVISKTLREYGDKLRKDIKEKIRSNDQTYASQVKKISPKVASNKKSPLERMAEALAMSNGIPLETAMQMLKGQIGNLPKQ